ncbi:MAG: M3 family metallopeptidase [Kiritimatiellia bacterium]
MNDNPFYKVPYYPAFDKMTPAAAENAIQKLLKESSDAVDKLEKQFDPSWQGLICALHNAQKDLYDAWGLLNHMLSVMNNNNWRSVHKKLLPEIIRFSQRVEQSRIFFDGYSSIKTTSYEQLDPVRQRILDKIILDAEQSGVGLPPDRQEEFNRIQTELGQLSTEFSNNLLDARKSYSLLLKTKEDVSNLPADILSITAAQAKEDGHKNATPENGPWKITLDYAVYGPFMKHSSNRSAREKLYREYVTLASKDTTNNQPLIDRILEYERKTAEILGFSSAAELSLSRKTAPDINAVYNLFNELANASEPTQKKERNQLLKFAKDNGFENEELRPWDMTFWAERQREKFYGYREEEISRYFQFPVVLQGMFNLVERIFSVRITEVSGEVPVWHKDVRFFQVKEKDGAPLACFYLDPYSRPETKRSGAWMNEFRTREKLEDESVYLPMAVMCCNQSLPTENKPSLMRMNEVTTLFHEFGHALQHMLTHIDEPQVSGINGIEWDAVEVASQFMENWCYDKQTLKSVSQHIDTGKELPDELFDKIVASKNYFSANAMMRQLFLGATDMDLYSKYPCPEWQTPDDVKLANADKYNMHLIDEDRFLCSFAHIFGGGYSAGYFSYKWSEVLSADCFAAFEEAGLNNEDALRKTGMRLRKTIMGAGGSRHPMEVFKDFRGREPDTEALLIHCGLK